VKGVHFLSPAPASALRDFANTRRRLAAFPSRGDECAQKRRRKYLPEPLIAKAGDPVIN
jgi:hypothetical protein